MGGRRGSGGRESAWGAVHEERGAVQVFGEGRGVGGVRDSRAGALHGELLRFRGVGGGSWLQAGERGCWQFMTLSLGVAAPDHPSSYLLPDPRCHCGCSSSSASEPAEQLP